MFRTLAKVCCGALISLPSAAFAHPGVAGHFHGISNGFNHPLSGIDHILAMVAVGLFAAHLGGRALWLVPATFVAMMAISGIAGMSGMELPFVEIGITASVIALGLAIAFQISVPTLVAAAFAGVFAIFHGYAHGAEMPASISGLAYGVGFVCATALLHGVGLALGLAVNKLGRVHSRAVSQVGGFVMAVTGVVLLFAS